MWFVYIVKCSDDTLYTGITNNLKERIEEHNTAKTGAKYTRGRRPVELIYKEEVVSKSIAAKREYEIKSLSRKEKQKLIS